MLPPLPLTGCEKRPIVVGGSGMYVSAVLDDLRFPGTDPLVRARLEAELEANGSTALHERLAAVDPAAAQAEAASRAGDHGVARRLFLEAAALAGLGIIQMPRVGVESLLAGGELVSILPQWQAPSTWASSRPSPLQSNQNRQPGCVQG